MQKPAPIRTDNITAALFVYENIHIKISKSWDMHYYWLRDRMTQEKLEMYWQRVVYNEVDFFAKHHATVEPLVYPMKLVFDARNFVFHTASVTLNIP